MHVQKTSMSNWFLLIIYKVGKKILYTSIVINNNTNNNNCHSLHNINNRMSIIIVFVPLNISRVLISFHYDIVINHFLAIKKEWILSLWYHTFIICNFITTFEWWLLFQKKKTIAICIGNYFNFLQYFALWHTQPSNTI